MRQFIAMTKKEFFESTATFRLYILLAAFLIFGMMSPLIAHLMPTILESAMADTGITMTLPEPSAMDAWTQFFSNIGQLGMLALVIVFCGIMSNELSRGTLTNLLTKGLKRRTVILAKFLSASLLWTVSYALSLAVCIGYTAYFWEIGAMPHATLAFAGLWLFGILMLALLLFGGTLFGNLYGSLFSCLGAVIVLNLIGIVPSVARYNPVSLAGSTLSLLSGESRPSEFIPAFLICIGLIVVLVAGAVFVFNRKKV
ncbi:MAG: ABC transporter permease [Oscillospiraceae bacterium]|nr:ABC transporter permease [Oscillospiraceae bacterium]